MVGEGGLRVMVGLCTAILVAVALHLAASIAAPITFALFTIALVWPVQAGLRARGTPGGLAMLATLLATLVTLVALGWAVAWGFGRVARWVVDNAALLQELYTQKLAWLDARGIAVGDGAAEGAAALGLDMRGVVRVAQTVLSQLQGAVTFLVLTLIYVLMGLLEADAVAAQLRHIGQTRPAALRVLAGLTRTAVKLRSYMMVRTLMSLLTGVAVWLFAVAMGLPLAAEWGVIAFALNYIPFIGPLVATLFPTLFAGLQFDNWRVALTVFLALQVIQNTIGSYIEPRVTGSRLALSPFMVLVAVFFGSFLWGIPGAFIGVPVLIAALTLCEEFPGSRWVAALLSGRHPAGSE